MGMNILVVGGAGYIGSHFVRAASDAGHRPVVLDSLVRGHREALHPSVMLYPVDLSDESAVGAICHAEDIDAVAHFGAFAYVGESVVDPLAYYLNNAAATVHLVRAMLRAGVNRLVFSSSCATYGIPASVPIVEGAPQVPICPYGQTKLDVETMLRAVARAHGLSFAALRYFNAAGAASDGTIGEDHEPETHLIPLAIGAATWDRPPLCIFGADYPTQDGTCLRDYIHVDDLSAAHLAVLPLLDERGAQLFYNLGTGMPVSVRQVISAVEKVTGREVPFAVAGHRAGDPPVLYADATRARCDLRWSPQYLDIEAIVDSAWRWHRMHPDGYSRRSDG